MIKLLYAVLLCSIFSTSCKKQNTSTPQTELEKLPPITQTGANTFGCLINGVAYLPQGYSDPYPNYRVFVDPSFRDGNFGFRVYSNSEDIRVDLNFGSDSLKSTGLYSINDNSKANFSLSKSSVDFSRQYCQIFYTGNYQKFGFMKITRYDLTNGIFSGEFECRMINTACGLGDTIKITNGRFDKKL